MITREVLSEQFTDCNDKNAGFVTLKNALENLTGE
jgi:hypothetical protein